MRAATFFRRAALLPAYDGAVRERERWQRVQLDRASRETSPMLAAVPDDPWAASRARRYPGQSVKVIGAAEMMNEVVKGVT